MKLERIETPEAAAARLVFTASPEELAAALASLSPLPAPEAAPSLPADAAQPASEGAAKAAGDAYADRMADAVNAAILQHFGPVYAEALRSAQLTPVTDPEFGLLWADEEKGFAATAEFFLLPELTVKRCTGFTQAVEPRPIRQLDIELEVNMHHAEEDRAADTDGRKALRAAVAREFWAKRCAQAAELAKSKLIYQLGAEVQGELPKMLVHGSYFAEQRRFSVNLQMKKLNFDLYLEQRGMNVEQFRAELHAQAEQRLRSQLGLLIVARQQGLEPTRAEAEDLLAHWDTARNGERTFYENDLRRAQQELASARAAAYVTAHSTLLPPPAEPVIAHTENGPQAR